jgi:hypothetical protein
MSQTRQYMKTNNNVNSDPVPSGPLAAQLPTQIMLNNIRNVYHFEDYRNK